MASMSKLVFKCISTYNPPYLIDHVQTHWTRGKVDIWMVDFIHKANAEHTLVLIDKKDLYFTLAIWMGIYLAIRLWFATRHPRMVSLLGHKTWRRTPSASLPWDLPYFFWFLYCWYFVELTSCFSYNFITSVSIRRLPGLGELILFFLSTIKYGSLQIQSLVSVVSCSHCSVGDFSSKWASLAWSYYSCQIEQKLCFIIFVTKKKTSL